MVMEVSNNHQVNNNTGSISSTKKKRKIDHVYTAIVLGSDDDDNNKLQPHPSKEAVVDQQDSKGVHHHPDGKEVPTASVSTTCDDNNTTKTTATKTSLWIGLLIGCFIQFSCLGANFVLDSKYSDNNDNAAPTKSEEQTLCFIWSMSTSILGVCCLFSICQLVHHVQQQHVNTPTTTNSTIWLEVYYAVGALLGVSLSWFLTDAIVLLTSSQDGYNNNSPLNIGGNKETLSSLSLWTNMMGSLLLAGIIWGCAQYHPTGFKSCLDLDDHDDDDDLSTFEEPLLPQQQQVHDEEDVSSATKRLRNDRCAFQWYSGFLGIFIGILIQASSLGANYVLAVSSSTSNETDDDNVDPTIWMSSFLWSFATSTMGVVVLLLVRNLLEAHVVDYEDNKKIMSDEVNQLLLQLECCFAIGATMGLNGAWMVTDYALVPNDNSGSSSSSHVWQSLWTLLATLVWCKLVLYCTTNFTCSTCNNANEDDDSDDDDEDHLDLL